ncbi:hypothetical protein DSO57_1027868 [Entomophthora muscae]|uniref:Uncharacterized protein n=1 Tax=Entomophthora muscae TaxID=34485 RepID=A0ACC2T1R5_9FUNG|nr:hypothetical protein DSO57_1027868 [Entomophthora muscae]
MRVSAFLGLFMGQPFDGAPKNEALTHQELPKLKVLLHSEMGGRSHNKAVLEIGQVLQEREHVVMYASSDSNEYLAREYAVPFRHLGKLEAGDERLREEFRATLRERKHVDPLSVGSGFFVDMVGRTYNSTFPRLSRLVESEQPDVMICDYLAPACRDVANMYGIPLVTTLQTIDGMGVTMAPYMTRGAQYGPITHAGMDFKSRFKDAVITPLRSFYHYRPMMSRINRIRHKFGIPADNKPFGDLNRALVLCNTFVGFEAAAPLQPNVHLIGPVLSDTHSALDAELGEFLEAHPRTLYVAFGSLVGLAPFDIENIIAGCLLAISNGDIDGVIWGLGQTSLEDFPTSVHVNDTDMSTQHLLLNQHPHMRLLSWAPQVPILRHPSTKAFLSHGGIESTFEAIQAGTPILCMPFVGEQPRTARKLEDAGIGKYIDRIAATPKTISKSIAHILEDPSGSLQANVNRMRVLATTGSRRKHHAADLIEGFTYSAKACRPSQPVDPNQIPCELRHLIPASHNMSFFKANLLDVYLSALIAAICIGSISVDFFFFRFFHIINTHVK